MPKFLYEKEDGWLKGEDSGFYNFYYHQNPGKYSEAFAGRKFDIPMKGGEVIKASGQWWDGVPEQYKNLSSFGVNTKDQLNKCNVFMSMNLDRRMVDDWLNKNRPSNNYYKYDKKSKNYMVQNIISRF